MASLPPIDLKNIQGDILEGLAKKQETFLFFRISDHVDAFRTQLASFVPLITSVNGAKKLHQNIKDAKKEAAKAGKEPPLLEMSGINIAFSQKGLNKLGIKDDIGDDVFKQGMLADVDNLGDDLADWDKHFKEEIHVMILVAANSEQVLDQEIDKVKRIFHGGQKDAGLVKVTQLAGHTRPGKEDGHEHFGFNDGLSQPAVKDVDTKPVPGQETVRQGVILLGREGDDGVAPPGTTAPGVTRPPWAIDGSFLAFRYLRQLVPEFDAFLEQNALKVPHPIAPGDPTGAELLGARLVGRWKSGAPVDSTPIRDDPALAVTEKNQDFRFDPNSQVRCPFAAHLRKTNPRADLDAFGGTEIRRILRRGIQFGPEVTDSEKKHKKSSEDEKLERGLLFACYQSNIANGFQFIQHSWVNTPTFPPGKTAPPVDPPVPNGAGVDPLIGIATPRQLVGTDPAISAANTELELTAKWVIPKGGEYLFSPSIKALKETFAKSKGNDEL
ncbi:hypothetical protein H2203_008897 [Taxawa tesnikishii (nom. ined.)]|nr:hypothetical protein H2203_008897 [Dothideales sp. JES 119]